MLLCKLNLHLLSNEVYFELLRQPILGSLPTASTQVSLLVKGTYCHQLVSRKVGFSSIPS